MRHRAIVLLALVLLLGVFSACDAENLPIAPTAAPTAAPATSTPVALQATDTPQAEALATATTPSGPFATDTPPIADISPTAEASAPTNTPGTRTEAGTTPTASSSADSQVLESELSEVESDTVRLRGLTPKKQVPAHFISPSEIKSNMVQQINEDYSPEKGKRDAMTLWLLRLIDNPSLDLYQLQIDLLGERILGFYDNNKHELFVRAEQGGFSPLERETLAHEFTHSLQDQYYNLNKMRPENIENDRGTAVTTLVEGDATVTQTLYDRTAMTPDELKELDAEKNSISSTVLDRTPAYIQDSLFFPYRQGPFFIQALAMAQPGSYKGINDALADPPQSTEQILHPEKYLDAPRDNPIPVTLPPLTSTLGAGWTFQNSDTLGEFDFSELLKINGVNDQEASAGWGGARYAFYEKGDGGIVTVDSVWDTPTDASEFDSAMSQSLKSFNRSGSFWTDGKRYFGMDVSGSHVVFAGGTDSAAVGKALAAIK